MGPTVVFDDTTDSLSQVVHDPKGPIVMLLIAWMILRLALAVVMPLVDLVFTGLCFLVSMFVANRDSSLWLMNQIGKIHGKIGREKTLLLGIVVLLLIDLITLSYAGTLPFGTSWFDPPWVMYLAFEPVILVTIIYSSVAIGLSIGAKARASDSLFNTFRVLGLVVFVLGIACFVFVAPGLYVTVFAYVADSNFGFFMIMLLLDVSFSIIVSGICMFGIPIPRRPIG